MSADKTLNIPIIKSEQYERNYINTAVCELKYPIILDLETNPPKDLHRKLRNRYPYFNRVNGVDVLPNGSTENFQHYRLQSADKNWVITIKPDGIALETTKYISFEAFMERLSILVEHTKEFIDSDFFTRVGLRYINLVPFKNNKFSGTINPELVSPVEKEVFGSLTQYAQIVQGYLNDGMYTFRHGMKPNEDTNKKSEPVYYLDFDYHKDMVTVNETLNLIKKFHSYNFSFFIWCLGPEAKKELGISKPKK